MSTDLPLYEPENIGDIRPTRGGPDKVVFDGRGGELFVIYLVNILLTIITLGIYRFWGKTRIRQYVWSHLRYKNDPLEYTGTGLELFLGFLVVIFLLLIPLFGLSFYIQHLIMQGEVVLAMALQYSLLLVIVALMPIAVYRAYRYRLSRTLWRGIRFGLTGKSTVYALKSFGYLLLQMITVGLAAPYTTVRLYEYLIGNIWMGSGRFSYKPSWKPLMKAFLPFWGAIVVTVGLYFLVMFNQMPEIEKMFEAMEQMEDGSTVEIPTSSRSSSGLLGALLGISIIATFVLSYYYMAAMVRCVVQNISFGNVSFKAEVTGRSLFGLYFINLLLLVFTLGIAYPWVLVRTFNYAVRYLEIHGEPDFEQIAQSTEESPKYGEGLAEAFDIGGI